jgi:hypothetical protein
MVTVILWDGERALKSLSEATLSRPKPDGSYR